MKNPVSRQELIAFADGELSGSRAREIRTFLAGEPLLRAEVQQLRELRARAAEALRTAPSNPQLRRRIEAMFDQAETTGQISSRPLFTIRRLAVAAVVLISIAAGLMFWLRQSREVTEPMMAKKPMGELPTPVSGDDNLLPEPGSKGVTRNVVLAATRKHLICERMADHFYDRRFPREIANVPKVAAVYLGADVATPDLSSIGLEFSGAGGCSFPGGKTLHVLYRSKTLSTRCVSLFVQPFEHQVSFDAGALVVLAGPTAAHPMLSWRSDRLVYFLIGDDFAETRGAAEFFGQRLGG